jgi:crotonobetainyl-CoA:carnitine CoA-transferase CaiB-like acyl-CoA transferase
MSPLAGIRVLDLSLQLPGPFCTLMMADHGADVVKVDEPAPRVRNPFSGEEWGRSPADRFLNRGKKSLTLNLKTEEGKTIFRALAQDADVVVEGFRPGVARRLGVDYASLSGANPRLVYCSISGYGQTGPMRDVAGHDINYISYAGVLGASGRPGAPPSIPPVQIGDLFGGAMMALTGILMALHARQATGRGRWVDVSMTDGALAMLSIHAAAVLAGMPPPERGSMILTGMFPCYETYRCACGGYMSVGPLESWFWNDFLKAVGREDLSGLQYAAGEEGERAKAELAKTFAGKTRDEWVAFFSGKDVCVSPVLDLGEALSHPQARARGMVVEVESPFGGRDRQLGRPLKFAGTGGEREASQEEPPRRSPRLGEHDEEILSELGYRDQEIEFLRRSGVIRRAEE